MSGTALAKVDLPSAPLARVGDLQNAIAKIESQCNLLMPLAAQDYIPPMHRVSMRAVNITDQDTYVDRLWCKNGEKAITKTGLMKILRARGASVIWSRRMDDRSDPHYCEWSVMLRAKEADGQVLDFQGTKEIDLRDGSALASKMKDGQLRGARLHIVANTETKALHRAIRGLCGLKQKYTTEELAKPFVTFAVVPDLDMSDPTIKRMAAAQILGSEAALYGGPALGAGESVDPETGEIIEPGYAEPEIIEPEIIEPEVIDAEPFPGEVDDSDPFSDVIAKDEPAPLPIPESVLAECPRDDEARYNYLGGFNAYAERAIEVFGKEKADQAFRKHATGIDWLTEAPSKLEAVKAAITADLKGGAS